MALPQAHPYVASSHEVRAAILQLTSRQLAALKFYAGVRIKILGRQARGRDHDDLLQEVIRSTISGERQWKMTVPFYVHLKASIRSISNAWSQKLAVDELPEDGFNPDDGKPYLKATDASTAGHTTINEQLDANAFLERLYHVRRQLFFPVSCCLRNVCYPTVVVVRRISSFSRRSRL